MDAQSVPGPMIVIANYVLDSLRQDQFRFIDGKVFENVVAVSAPEDCRLDQKNFLNSVSLVEEYRPVTLPYYDDEVLDGVLRSYASELHQKSELLIPVGMYQCLDALRRLSDGPSLSLIDDLGVRFLEEIEGARIASFRSNRPGYFWFKGNFNALMRISRARGGMTMFSDEPDGHFVIGAFVEGASAEQMPRTRDAFEQEIRGLGPSEVRELIKPLKKVGEKLEADSLLYLLKLSDWDPTTLLEFAAAINRQPEAWTGLLRNRLVEALRQVGENHYPLGNAGNLPMRLAQLFALLNEMADTKIWIHRSIAESGANQMAYRALAECHRLEGDTELAEKFEKLAAALENEQDAASSDIENSPDVVARAVAQDRSQP